MEKVHGVLVTTLIGMLLFFGVDISLSSHADNRMNSFLVLSGGPTYDINGSFGGTGKKLLLNLVS